MPVEFLEVAAEEFLEAIAYYNGESEGLGYEFASEVKRTLARIAAYPSAWVSLSRNTRRCRTIRFPYGVLYQVRGDLILVVAVMHLHREPRRWQDRSNAVKP